MNAAYAEKPVAPAHILHVVDSLAAGGTEMVSATVIEHTAGRYHHSVCCLRGTGPATGALRNLDAPVAFLDKRDGHDWGLALRIARLCRRLRPQVVHARNWGTIDAVIGARLARVPVVIHSEHGREANDLDGLRRRRIHLRRLLSRWVDTHVVVSLDLQRWLTERVGVPPHKVKVVRNGVDTARFKPLADRDDVRSRLGFSPSGLVLVAVGRLDPVKDHHTLLDGFQLTAARRDEVSLVIVGDGTERRSLEELVRRRGLGDRVRFVGHRDDVEKWLAVADVFAHASLMEGSSNAVLEAMAVGLPVVATNVGGTPEIVEHGVTGLLVPSADAGALAAALLTYCEDEVTRGAHGRAARERATTQYPLNKMLAAYAEVYDDALARSAGTDAADANRVRSS